VVGEIEAAGAGDGRPTSVSDWDGMQALVARTVDQFSDPRS
jgi:hypothetical protein